MVAFPQVQAIIDAKEHRVNNPAGEEAQMPYLLGQEEGAHGQDPGGDRHAGGS
jgi:hypothetical protein